jgi:NAD(P)-dependent dehydrogenase (short-subunit alcohol dehydrogenase family)
VTDGLTGQPRTVVITGASSGIGFSAARMFAARGERLVLAARCRSSLEVAAEVCLLDGAASTLVVPTDVADGDSVGDLIRAACAEYGGIDVVVHAAAVMAYGSIEVLPEGIFRKVVDTAIHGTASVARSVLPVFRQQQQGVLIIVSSVLSSIAVPVLGAYTTAKWGQAGLIRVLQLETRDAPGIRVCSVAPSAVNTPIYYQAANYSGRGARPPIPVDPPEKVAAAIVRCADRPRDRVAVGLTSRVLVFGFRALPSLYDLLVGPLLRLGAMSSASVPATPGNVEAPMPMFEEQRGRWPHRWGIRRA